MVIGVTKKKEKILLSIGVVIIITASLLLTSISGCSAKSVNTPTAGQTTVHIKYPTDNGIVQIRETIIGTAKNIPEGKHLWILIYPHSAYKYYPQYPVNIESNGSWKLPVQFGGEEHVGYKFDIYAVLADDNAQKELNKYIEESEKTKSWNGIRVLPDGTKISTKLTVIRASPKSAKVTPAEIKITYPSDSATVQMKETLAGTAKKIPKGKNLWIAIYPQNAYKYYPQKSVNVQNDGSWTLPVQFGEAVHSGIKFDICAILADNNAHKELSKYIKASKKAKSWDGIKFLPRGTKTITKLTVIRA